MKRTFLLLILSLFSMTFVYAYDFSVANSDGVVIYYSRSGTNATVTYKTDSYNSYSGVVVIPNEVDYEGTTYAVTSIGLSAFNGCSGLTSLTIPNSVTSIGTRAFSGCSGLKNVVLEDGTTTLSFGTTSSSLSDKAFENCPLESLYLGRNISYYCSDNTVTYLSPFTKTTLTSLTIGSSVTYIESGAFKGCSGLTSLTISNSVTSIKLYAFSGCSGLTSLTIPNSVTSIEGSAFNGCSGLTSLTIPNSVTSISGFSGCSGLTSLTIPNSVTLIGKLAFSGCSGLTSLTIPNSVTLIGASAFSGCSGLTSLTIPNSVTLIGESAFSGCSGLKNVVLEDSTTPLSFATNDSNEAFENCPLESLYLGRNITYYLSPFESKTTLTSLTIGNSVTSIGIFAFYGCSGLTSLTIPNSVTSIGSSAFYKCRGLTSLTIPNSVTSIGEYAFSGCRGLTSLTIPNSVTSIDYLTFEGCSGLTSLTIPNSVTSIGIFAFSGCSELTSLTIPNSVTSIGGWAFSGCSGLTEINSKSPTPPKVENSATFEEIDKKACTLYVPVGCAASYSGESYWKDFLIIKEKEFPSETSINTIASDTEISAIVTGNGIKINGCNPSDKVGIYTVTGQTVYSSVIGNGFISCPVRKGVVYIIHTPKKSLKVIY